jgi:hypothetical protein
VAQIVLVVLAWLASGAAPLEAQAPPAGRPPSMNAIEQGLADRIYVRLAERAWVGADFDARVDHGVVTLSGTVPSARTKAGVLRIVRRTSGVTDVIDRLRVDPAASPSRSSSPVPDAELSQRVAQRIAGAVSGAKAGEDWWFTGWRVEGPYQGWTMVVHAADGSVTWTARCPRPPPSDRRCRRPCRRRAS